MNPEFAIVAGTVCSWISFMGKFNEKLWVFGMMILIGGLSCYCGAYGWGVFFLVFGGLLTAIGKCNTLNYGSLFSKDVGFFGPILVGLGVLVAITTPYHTSMLNAVWNLCQIVLTAFCPLYPLLTWIF